MLVIKIWKNFINLIDLLLDYIETLCTFYIVFFVIYSVIAIVGLVGIINENEKVVIFLTVLSALEVFGALHVGRCNSVIAGLLTTIFHGVYAKMIFKKKQNSREKILKSFESNSYYYEKDYNYI
jgi:hypothetical protein